MLHLPTFSPTSTPLFYNHELLLSDALTLCLTEAQLARPTQGLTFSLEAQVDHG